MMFEFIRFDKYNTTKSGPMFFGLETEEGKTA